MILPIKILVIFNVEACVEVYWKYNLKKNIQHFYKTIRSILKVFLFAFTDLLAGQIFKYNTMFVIPNSN